MERQKLEARKRQEKMAQQLEKKKNNEKNTMQTVNHAQMCKNTLKYLTLLFYWTWIVSIPTLCFQNMQSFLCYSTISIKY